MKLLELRPEVAPGAPPEPPEDAPRDEPQADPAERTCKSCGATMEPGQDWCLACGTAAGRLGERPGWRAAMTVLGLTIFLVAGAVAASYAALRSDPAAPPASTNAQVAQAPVTTAPPAATTTAPPETTPTTPDTTSTDDLPKVQVPSTPSTSSSPPATPATPVTPAPATPRTSSPPAQTPPPSSTSGGGSGGGGGGGQTNSTPTTTTPKPAAPVAIDLAASAASLYDPYRRATSLGVPGKALDGDGGTSWYVDPAAGDTVAIGYVLNLGEQRGIKSVDVTTPTPGFKVEVYATDEATPPPTITDTRWAHITDKSDVGEGGKSHIVLGAGSSKYQTLLLWITKPPADGARVRISELKVFG
jgi:hypothetical protein